jgi:hypothetical protein
MQWLMTETGTWVGIELGDGNQVTWVDGCKTDGTVKTELGI